MLPRLQQLRRVYLDPGIEGTGQSSGARGIASTLMQLC